MRQHGFKTREEWNTAFTAYFSQIQRINQMSYDLLNEEASFYTWMQDYQNQSETVQTIFKQSNEFLNNHIRYFHDHPNRLTEEIADALLAYLYRYCMRMEDTEADYIAVTMLLSYYEEKDDEIAIMKCCFVLTVIYMFLDLYNFSDICLKYIHRGIQLFEKHYDELDEETKSMGISFYDFRCNVLYTSIPFTRDFPEYFKHTLRYALESGLKRIDQFMKEADLNLPINAILPEIKEEMIESFITLTLKIPKNSITPQQAEYIAGLTAYCYKESKEGLDDIKKWKAQLALMMAKRLTTEVNYEDLYQTMYNLLIQIPDMNITRKEDYNDFFLDLLQAFSSSFQTLIKEDESEGKAYIGCEILRKLTAFISSLPYEKYLQHGADGSVFHDVLTLIRFLPDEQSMIDSVLKLTIYRQLQTAVHTKMVARSADIITRHLLDKQPTFFTTMPFFMDQEDVELCKEHIKTHVHNGAMLHDVGKILCTSIINMQYRKITALEFETIRFHPITSGKILNKIPLLSQYHDLAVGHHKSYDGTFGYPKDFDNLHSPQKAIIDLITICDSLDAATDTYGRNYARTKTFDEVMIELNKQKGTRYSASIVDFILTDPHLYQELNDLFTNKRIDVYREVHDIL